MAYPATTNNLSVSRTAGQIIVSADINAIAVDVNQLTLRAGGAVLATRTTTYAITASDCVVPADATGGAFTMTLPTAIGVSGKEYRVKKIDAAANTVTIATTSSQTIDGATTLSLVNRWDAAIIISNGANWLLF